MKRHKWSDIKARTSPGTRARIEAEGQRFSENVHPVTDVKTKAGAKSKTEAASAAASVPTASASTVGPASPDDPAVPLPDRRPQ